MNLLLIDRFYLFIYFFKPEYSVLPVGENVSKDCYQKVEEILTKFCNGQLSVANKKTLISASSFTFLKGKVTSAVTNGIWREDSCIHAEKGRRKP